MKKCLSFLVAVLLGTLPLCAQRLVIGERAPELSVERWITDKPVTDGRAVMVAFYHSSSPGNGDYLDRLDDIGGKNGGTMCVVVVIRENDERVIDVLLDGEPSYYVGYDGDGSVFAAFEAHYVPYSVIYGRRGRIQWVGNPSSLTDSDIARIIKR